MESIVDNYANSSSNLSQIMCEVCEQQTSKYRCPRCEKCSCSLICSKQHKLLHACSGRRDRTGYVKRSNFDEQTFHSDVAFLEDAARIQVNAHKLMTSVDPMSHKEVLVQQANQRQVDLRLLAEWFPKRKENLTYYKGNQMYWTVRWIIHTTTQEQDPSHRKLGQSEVLVVLHGFLSFYTFFPFKI